ncbi:RNA polymerase sigma-70 factor [Pedobacter sp. BS3]|uniref:RNA polymerase sigma factor n=1 Tax=Pedobacter sp. BS3 TaxID=2567937 RepID=UPI0011EEF6B0|nr:RNA polymerase sigma-70 factor [Pedobacter sp. BS3]TZF82817.1 RNA polymerase sigma-70 factor [Pedobacter sp. BS3]
MNETILLNNISLGDEYAFRVIFDKYRTRVYSYALKIIKSGEQAEEILHDVFLKLWQHENPAGIENLEAWLRVVVRNTTLKVLRRNRLEMKADDVLAYHWEESHNQTEDIIFLHDSAFILNQAIELLPPQQKQVYKLCRIEGLKYAQAAERLSLSPLTVKTHMQHALRFLRSYVTKHSDVVLFITLLQIFLKNR